MWTKKTFFDPLPAHLFHVFIESFDSKIEFRKRLEMIEDTLDSGINVGVRLLIFGLFSSGYVLIKGGTFINFFIFSLLNIFF